MGINIIKFGSNSPLLDGVKSQLQSITNTIKLSKKPKIPNQNLCMKVKFK